MQAEAAVAVYACAFVGASVGAAVAAFATAASVPVLLLPLSVQESCADFSQQLLLQQQLQQMLL